MSWTRIEPAPGPRCHDPAWTVQLTDDDGQPLHGTYLGRLDPETTRYVVANNGRIVDQYSIPHYTPRFTHPAVSSTNNPLGQWPWLWTDETGRTVASDPNDTNVALIIAGRKPGGVPDTDNRHVAASWAAHARAAGLEYRATTDTTEGTAVHFVTVATRATLGDHFDLDALIADYEAAGITGDDLADVRQELHRRAGTTLADILAEDDIVGQVDVALKPGKLARTGLVLGYHPATTIALIRNKADDRYGRTPPEAWEFHDTWRRAYATLDDARATLPGLQAFARTDAARNEPCPCGSGTKAKRCCRQ